MAEPGAALFLADQDAGEAHFGELLPQIAREAGGGVRVAQGSHVADGGVFGDEILRGIAQHRLFVVEIEGHYLLPLPLRGEGRGEGAVSRGRPIVRKVLTAPLPTLSPEGERAISIGRSEEHTSELQSLMRISYAVFCLKNKK